MAVRRGETGDDYRNVPVQEASEILRKGGLVAFPTETVYGLGGDAENPEAVKRIFSAKGRPADHPLIVHIPNSGELSRWAREVPPEAFILAERYWPGPLTLILKRDRRVPDIVTGGQDTVGLRVPDHPVALALLEAFGGGIAAPSANRFGRVSPTTAAHVREELGDAPDLILDGGPCRVGIESTILDLSTNRPILMRPGAITGPEIEDLLGLPVSMPGSDSPRAPGRMKSHYAPNTPVFLVSDAQMEEEIRRRIANGQRVAVLTMSPTRQTGNCLQQSMPDTPAGWAHELYASLRILDNQGFECILVEIPPFGADWQGVQDRLMRAAEDTFL
ncbi:MAG: L-threonylcarbamoyladenylate synthase [Leptospirales bacterium]